LADVYIALVHSPVYNKNREIITSALTTIDLHDLARLAATYGLAGFYAVTPLTDQLAVAEEMVGHWRFGWGARYNSNRAEAISLVSLVRTLEEAAADINSQCGRPPLVVGTSASAGEKRVDFAGLKKYLEKQDPLLVLFGTAWGLTEEALDGCDLLLEPITGPTEYNHLSVRSAAGIILDRLLGR
jgi:hypothetical protein